MQGWFESVRRKFSKTTGRCPARAARPGRRLDRIQIEPLERRLLLTFDPSGVEQEMVYDINHVRVDPQGELGYLFTSLNPLTSPDTNVNLAMAQFGVDPNAFLSQWQALVPTNPVAWNASLYTASLQHDQAMIAGDMQSHQLPGEPTFDQRDINAGYLNGIDFAENIFASMNSVFYGHSGFLIDWGNATPGHRTNIMNPLHQEVGVGIVAFSNPASQQVQGPLVVTQDFGARSDFGNPDILGVAFTDTNRNGRYDAGEGLANVTISVTGTGGTFSATTLTAGGYQVKVPAGTYTVTASGPGFTGTTTAQVTVGSANVEVDAVSGVASGFVNFKNSAPATAAQTMFVIGGDSQVYSQKFDAAGNSISGYALTQAGGVLSIEVGSDASHRPVVFAVGGDHQVYVQKFDASGNSASGWTLAGAGAVQSIAVGHDGSNNPELFVVGGDNQVYAHKFDANGNPAGSYFLIGAGAVKSMAVGSDGTNHPEVFVIGGDNRIYAQRFDASGSPLGSYFLAAAGAAQSIVAGHDASNTPEIFVKGFDSQIYALHFDVNGNSVGSFFAVAAGVVSSPSIGYDASNNPELFGIGGDGQVYGVKFNASGTPVSGYFLIPSGAVKAFTVSRNASGNPQVFVIGGDNQVYLHAFDGAGTPVGAYTLTKAGGVNSVRLSG